MIDNDTNLPSEDASKDSSAPLDESSLDMRLRQVELFERIIDAQLEHFASSENSARDLVGLLHNLMQAKLAVVEEKAKHDLRITEQSSHVSDLDLGAARHEVCQRLARVRRCCGANRVPRGPK